MPTLRAKARRVRRRLTDEQPFEVYLSIMCVFAGVWLVLGGAEPAALDEVYPSWLVRVLGAELALGGAVTVWGLGRPQDTAERFGLSCLAAACIVYSFALGIGLGADGVVPGAIVFGLGLACLARRGSVRRVITQRLIVAEDVEAELECGR